MPLVKAYGADVELKAVALDCARHLFYLTVMHLQGLDVQGIPDMYREMFTETICTTE